MNIFRQTKSRVRKRSRRVSMSLAAGALALGITACGSDNDTTNPPAAQTIDFQVAANSNQEVPATPSLATATGTFTLDSGSGALTGSVTTSGVTTQMAHIHSGFAGANGPVIVGLDVAGDTLSVPDGTVLTSDQISAMQGGGYYLNVHSTAFPAGEIRGQITPPGIQVLLSDLSGAQEVPAEDSQGSGTAYLTIDEQSGASTINVRTTGLGTPTMAHLHMGAAGTNGPVLIGLEQDANEIDQFSTAAGAVLDADGLSALLAGQTYVNVHTEEVPSGELRGQVLPSGVSLLLANLNGEQEVPAVTSTAMGTGYVTVNSNTSTVSAVIDVVGANDASMAHIHTGAFGANGPVLIGLEQDGSNPGLWTITDAAADAAGLDALLTSGTYFNVHTPANASGEIRGQILPQ